MAIYNLARGREAIRRVGAFSTTQADNVQDNARQNRQCRNVIYAPCGGRISVLLVFPMKYFYLGVCAMSTIGRVRVICVCQAYVDFRDQRCVNWECS